MDVIIFRVAVVPVAIIVPGAWTCKRGCCFCVRVDHDSYSTIAIPCSLQIFAVDGAKLCEVVLEAIGAA